MDEMLLMDQIQRLEEEIRTLHAKDSTIKAILALQEITMFTPITQEISGIGQLLQKDLHQCLRLEENFYLRQEVYKQRKEIHGLRDALDRHKDCPLSKEP